MYLHFPILFIILPFVQLEGQIGARAQCAYIPLWREKKELQLPRLNDFLLVNKDAHRFCVFLFCFGDLRWFLLNGKQSNYHYNCWWKKNLCGWLHMQAFLKVWRPTWQRTIFTTKCYAFAERNSAPRTFAGWQQVVANKGNMGDNSIRAIFSANYRTYWFEIRILKVPCSKNSTL